MLAKRTKRAKVTIHSFILSFAFVGIVGTGGMLVPTTAEAHPTKKVKYCARWNYGPDRKYKPCLEWRIRFSHDWHWNIA